MPSTIQCIHCGKTLHAPAGMAGKRVRCAHCQREFVMPEPTPGSSDIATSTTLAAPRPVGGHDEMLSRSMLVPMPGMKPVPNASAEEMICRLQPKTLRWMDVSEGLRRYLGRPLSQLRQETFVQYLHEDDRALAEDEFRQAIERGERHDFVLRLQGETGQWHYMRIYTQARYEPNGQVNHVRCNLKDVTGQVRAEQELRRRTEQLTAANEQLRQINQKLKETQAQLVHSEKLASLGTLASGMAHEINNPLAFATNNVVILERELASLLKVLDAYEAGRDELKQVNPERAAEIGRLREDFDVVYLQQNLSRIAGATRKGLSRVAQIVQNLRNFAQIDRAEIGEVSLNELLVQCLGMLNENLSRQRVTVHKDFGVLPLLEGAPAHLNQVFLNLLMNALQAIEATGKPQGRIDLVTRHVGDTIVVEIADDGCGIPAEKMPKIFDPFFTTKPLGRGTGLGLSLSHGIISDHGGRIEVESTVGAGTRFRIVLPLKRAVKQPDTGTGEMPAVVL
ncbi:MAG: ATP-binding protein [Isosphaeraceae bacterium]|nr:ATP-binding protein [Isosphaeraceae bacterium]